MAGTNYTIDYTDITLNGKTPFTVEAGSLNSTTSLYLFGQGYLRYGEYANENFVKLLENFASRSAPPRPTIGQLWFDGTNNVLKVYNNTSNWVEIGGGSSGSDYTLPTASGSTLGGVKVGTGLAIDGSGILRTTYTAGTGVTISGTTISVTFPITSAGSNGQMLYTNGSAPYWGNAPSGTGTTYIAGDGISIAGSTISVATGRSVPVGGTSGQMLYTNGSAPYWAAAPAGGTSGAGTVTSVNGAVSSGMGLTLTGGPITTSGTLTLGGTLSVANGGTGATSAAAALTALGGLSQTTGDARYIQLAGTLAISGGGTGATTAAAALTNLGAVASSGGSLSNCVGLTTNGINNTAVTYAKIQNVSTGDRLLGRVSGSGNVEEIVCTAAGRSLLAAVTSKVIASITVPPTNSDFCIGCTSYTTKIITFTDATSVTVVAPGGAALCCQG